MEDAMIQKRRIVYSLSASLLLLLIACGGGDGDGTPNNASVSSNLNGDFKGRLFIGSEEDGPWIMDFSTGRYAPVPGVLWEDNSDYFHSADFSAYPVSYDGIEFIETIGKCRRNPGLLNYDDCIILRDSQGEIVSQFDVPYETHGQAKLSRDRQYFAVPIQVPGDALNPKTLTLFSRDGALIDASDEDVHSFDWLPDNRLIYATDQSIYITPLGSATAKGVKRLTLPENVGQPAQFAVSPNGSQLAFTLVTDANFVFIYGTTWILSLDGSNLRQLTNTPGKPNHESIINFPTWSPNGRWIAVVEGFVTPCQERFPCIRTQSNLYVVPSDGDNIILTEDGTTTSAVLIYSYNEETNRSPPDNPELSSRFNIRRGSMAWLR